MKKIFSILAVLMLTASVMFALDVEVNPYVRATLTPGDANCTECDVYDGGLLKTEAAWGIGGGADILNFTENTVLGADLGVKVHHLDFGYRSYGQEAKDKNTSLGFELTPYIKYKTKAINFGFGPMIGVNYADVKYHTDPIDRNNVKDYKRFNIDAGGRIFAEIPFANQRFALVPAINYSRQIYLNEHNRYDDTTNKGWFCDHYTNGAKAWASFSVKCNL